MQKLARRSLSMVLAIMLVLTTIVGALTVTAETQAEPFTEYNATSETAQNGRFPLALVGADAETDGMYNNRYFVAQEFVPAKDTLYGVQIGLKVGAKVTVHAEIRSEVNNEESVIASTNLNISGGAETWERTSDRYTFRFPEPVAVTPGQAYYVVFYMTKATDVNNKDGGDCSLRADSRAELEGYTAPYPCPLWKYKQSAADATYAAGSGSLIADFKVLDTLAPFTEYTAVSATGVEDGKDGGVRFPMAYVNTEAGSDQVYDGRQYAAQEFVPSMNTLLGVEIGMKAGHRVAVRAEVRTEVNNPDSVIASKDIEITGVWYHDSQRKTFIFDNPVTVTPGKPYYIVTYITRKIDPNGDCYLRADSRLELTEQYTPGDDLQCPLWTCKQEKGEVVYGVGNRSLVADFRIMEGNVETKNIVEVSMKNLDGWSGYAGNYNQEGSGLDTADYTQGTASWKFNISNRSNMKPFIYGNNEGGGTNDAPKVTDISSVIDKNGDFYFAYDIYVDDPATLTSSRFVVGIGSRTATNTAANVDKAAMEICKYASESDARNNVTWAEMGLPDGPKAGWNHVAIKLNANPTSDTYTNKFDTKAADSTKNNMSNSWDPKTVWYVQFYADGAGVGKSNWVKIDDIRFMSVDAYEANFADSVKVKEAIIAINAIADSDDEANIAAAAEKLEALSEEQLAQVTNYAKYQEIINKNVLDQQIHSMNNRDGIVIASGNQGTNGTQGAVHTANYTEGTGSHFSNWSAGAVKGEDGTYKTNNLYLSLTGLNDLDFSKADYIAFDVYVHGFKSIFTPGKNDVNIGLGTAATGDAWASQDLWTAGNTAFGGITNAWKEGWNHVLIPVSAPNATAVKTLKIYMEKAIEFTADDPYVLFDDFRMLNKNAASLNTARNEAKDLIAAIAQLTIDNAEGIAAAKETYGKLTDEQKAMVTNYDRLEKFAAAPAQAKAVVDMIAAIPANVTYAGKAQIDAAAEAYSKLNDIAKGLVTNYATLQGYQKMLQEEEKAAANVANLIDALPAVDALTLDNESKVIEARTAYDALHADTKSLVTNLAKLVAAEARIEELKDQLDDAGKAQLIIDAINKLPAADAVVVGDESAIAAVNTQYNNATDAVKALVNANADAKAKFDAVNAALAQAKTDKAAADAVVAKINALPAKPMASDKDQVVAARTDYNNLNDKAKAYVPKAALDTLVAAEASVAKDEKDIADAQKIKDGLAALPEEITEAQAETVKELKNSFEALTPEAKAMLSADEKKALDNAYKNVLFLNPIDIQFRALDTRGADTNNAGGDPAKAEINKQMQLEGTGCLLTTFVKQTSKKEMHINLYAYDQLWNNDYTVDGCRLLPVKDYKDMYMTLDVYVSDAEALKNVVGDVGMGLDTLEPNKWGDMVQTKANLVKNAFKDIQNGWNHIVIPMSFRQSIKDDMLRVYDFRIYFVGVSLPENWQIAIDDVRFMDGAAVATILPERSKAKDVTLAIRGVTDETSFEDQAANIVDVYNSLAPEYQELVIGYEEFFAAYSAKYADQIAAKDAADAAAAKPVQDAIAALNETITVADKAAVEKASADYDALTLGQKNKVTNAAVLKAAVAALDAALAKAVDDQITALPETIAVADKEKVEAARAAYEALTEAQKALVTKLADLEADEAALVVAQDKAAAKVVSDQIAKLPAVDKLALTDEQAVNDARKAYDALTDAQKGYVDNYKALTDAEAQIKVLKEVKLGDVNEDGKFDAKDALLVLKFAVGKEKLTEKQQKAADVNKDGKINAQDALEILKKAVNKPACF